MFGLTPISSSALYALLSSDNLATIEFLSFKSPNVIALAGHASAQAD